MHYYTQKQNSTSTSAQISQSGSQLVQDASQTQQSWNTNHQLNAPNSRVQQLQSSSVSHSQAQFCRQTTNQNSTVVAPSDQSAIKKKYSSLLISLLSDGTFQNNNQTLANQSPASTINKNTPPSQHTVSAEWQQCNISSYSQRSSPQQSSNEGVAIVASASPTAAALSQRQQGVHPKTSPTVGSFIKQSAHVQNSSPNSKQGYSTSYPVNVGRQTPQPVANSDLTLSPVNTQLFYIPITNLKTNQKNDQLSVRQVNLEYVSNSISYCPLPTPPNSITHLINLPRISNHVVLSPATVLNKTYIRNARQLQPLQSKTHQSVSPGPVLFLVPEISLPNNASIGSARVESGRGQSVHVSLPNNSMVLVRNPVMSSSDGCLPHQVPESLSSQTIPKTKDTKWARRWREEISETFAQKHSSQVMPTQTSTRAVAVVQPLSQEGDTIPTDTTSRKSLINPEKECDLPTVVNNSCVDQRVAVDLDKEIPITKESNNTLPNTKAVMANSGLDRQKFMQELEVSNRNSPQCLSKEHLSGKEANVTPSPAPYAELSSIPTITWTAAALRNVIQETEVKSQVIPEDFPSDLQVKLQRMFEDIIHTKVNAGIKSCWKENLLSEVKLFCDQHVSPDSVVLSQVKEGFKEQLKHYHVLSDGVYSEQPYKSLWLNVNKELDDIDNEFGFPWTLRRHFYVDESDSQKDEDRIENNFCKPAINELPEKNLSVSEVNSAVTDQPSSVQPPLTPTDSSNYSSGEDSSDPNYLFKIQVLSPVEAKALYEDIQKDHHITGGQKEIVESNHMKTDIPNHTDATSTRSEVKMDPIDQICCLGKFMEMNSRLNTPSVKCLCKEKPEECNNTEEALTSDPKNLENILEDGCEIITLSGEELPTEFYQTIDLTEDDKPDLAINHGPKMEHCITVDHLSDIDMTSSAEEDEPSNECGSLEEIPNFVIKLSESEEESAIEEATSLQTASSSFSDDCTKQAKPLKPSSPAATVPLQAPEEEDEFEQTSFKCEDETRKCVEMKNLTDIGPKTSSKTLITSCFRNAMLKKKQRSLCTFSPSLKELQASTSEEKSVKLVLFGSANQGKCVLPVIETDHHSSPTLFSVGPHQPPQVLSLNIKSSQKSCKEAACSRKHSVKQIIYEKWSKSFPSCYRNKMKRQKRHSASFSKSQRKNKQQDSSEIRDSDGKGKVSLSQKRTRSLSNTLGIKEAKRRRYSVSLEQTAHCEQRITENEVNHLMPLKKDIVLKFSTLPNSFSFKDGSNVGKEFSGQTETANNNQSPENVVKTIKSNKDFWCPSPDQHSQSLKIPKNSNLFEEYQKKYQEKNQTSSN